MNKIVSQRVVRPINVMKGDTITAIFDDGKGNVTEKSFTAKKTSYLNHMNVYVEDEFDDLDNAYILAVGEKKK